MSESRSVLHSPTPQNRNPTPVTAAAIKVLHLTVNSKNAGPIGHWRHKPEAKPSHSLNIGYGGTLPDELRESAADSLACDDDVRMPCSTAAYMRKPIKDKIQRLVGIKWS